MFRGVRCRFCGEVNCMGYGCLRMCGCKFDETTQVLTPAEDCDVHGIRIPRNQDLIEGKYVNQVIADIVSPDAPMTENADGGKQSQVDVRFDLIDARAMFEMAKVLDHGAKKYGADNWRLIPVQDHLNHLLMHLFAYLAGDTTDDHLSHILCRATFALGVELEPSKPSVAMVSPCNYKGFHYQHTWPDEENVWWHCEGSMQ